MSVGSSIKRFVAEITRRRVLYSLGAYVVAALFVLEAADLVLPSMAVPEYVYDILVALLILLLPVVLVLSWYFDLTARGIVRTDVAHVGADEPQRSGKRPAALKKGSTIRLPDMPEQAALAYAGRSVAILPFANKSDDTEAEYLSDGITEAIINKLARLSNIRVIPRASAFRYKASNLDLQEICKELRVRSVVTGSVKHFGERLVVQAELVDTHREAQVWGEQYSEPWENLLDLQEEIAAEISSSLKPELTGEERERIQKRDTEHLSAYQDYLRGRYHWNKRTADGLKAAAEHFRSAIDRDPLYAAAYSGLADTYNIMGYYGVRAPDDTYPRAKIADQKALEIQPDLAEAYASLGYSTLFYDRDCEAAQKNFVKAIELNPDYSTAHQWYAWYHLVQENFEKALNCFKHAMGLDPKSLIINDHLAYGYILVGNMDKARQQIERTRNLDPTYPLALWRLGDWCLLEGDYEQAVAAYSEADSLTDGLLALGYLGLAYALTGREDDARNILSRLDAYQAQRYVSPLDRAFVHAGLGETDAAFGFINQALKMRVSDMVRFKLLPWPSSIKSDPRFVETISALNLT